MSNLEKPLSQQHRNFFADVWDVVRQVPEGRVTNYGAIARYLGTGMSARMVGWAMNAAHGEADVPAHRVVNHKGLLTGKMHFRPPGKMEALLKKEGIPIENNAVVNFEDFLWDPSVELEL